MSNDDLRAAAEFVRRHATKNSPSAVVADAYLSEHPADNGEPVTEEWLRSAGFKDATTKRYGLRNWTVRLFPPCGNLGWFADIADTIPGDGRGVPIATPATRGHVRRLCAALGITINV